MNHKQIVDLAMNCFRLGCFGETGQVRDRIVDHVIRESRVLINKQETVAKDTVAIFQHEINANCRLFTRTLFYCNRRYCLV